ncbi:lipase member H-like [Plodia interpunctella]|uniref:lipase member H-like n=1 Tax=Plodia interpunctella TaxID=58824 RepID=UPI002367CE4E|nr:lipase member H-like [Plodia interpunctella]
MAAIIYSLILIVFFSTVHANFKPFRALLYSDWITCDHNKTLDLDVSQVQLFLYDFQNNFNISYQIDNAAENILSAYNLDTTRRLIFFVPGYKSHISKNTEELIRQTFKDVPNIYLIIVDHSPYTSARGGKIKSYERSVTYTYYIGRALGKFLADLHSRGFPSDKIHCIGHSLGSQMLGYAGSTYTNQTLQKVWRVTGIDPAGPCFSNGFIQDHIRSGVGNYVEVYHCNAGGLGTTAVLADIDFFLNRKGKKQPHCDGGIIPGLGESDSAKCSHKACVKYWTATVHNPTWYSAWACDSYDHFMDGRCAGNEITIAGYSNPGNATGVFYASTDGYGVD